MSGRIRYCSRDRRYTLFSRCPICGAPTHSAHPARFSPEDRYGRYRREAKRWMT
ncbi:RNA-protein complex protein Nop10 [Methanofollis fontis]|uniref:Ribosome biogenesis protein Nop10 n=1 Tax=Methanofollis fontis TaxID=2052832 RepID=A0A483CUP6_9EURY|nr:RNA-protein complex protein Nop10 [Methanofollis fontis]TAJ45054.1 ribosome biogenesis protein [Methanofollis fontis]